MSTPENEQRKSVGYDRYPEENESMRIHRHPSNPKNGEIKSWPSGGDIGVHAYSQMLFGKHMRTDVVSVHDGRTVAGLVFFQLRDPKKFGKVFPDLGSRKRYQTMVRKLLGAIRVKDPLNQVNMYMKLRRLLQDAGIKIRFVPNAEQGYVFKSGTFKLSKRD